MIPIHILWIDENPIVPSEVLFEVLEEEEDMHVTAPGTLLEDVAEIERLQPDLILIYIKLDGTQERVWTCVQRLKSHQATKDIPVVLSGHNSVELFAYLTRELGPMLTLPGVEYVCAPFDLDAFLSRLRQLVADSPSLS
jgi:DNA-binding response OmpR family regulator